MPSRIRLGLALLFATLFALAPAISNAQSAAPISLAFLLPKSATAAPGSGESAGTRTAYDAGVVAAGALIASDDKGIYRTIQGPNGPSKSEESVANDVTKLGDLTYVAPALGALYLTGGVGNRDLAWRSGLAVVRAGIIGVTIKEVVGRERPNGIAGGSATTFHPFKPSEDRYTSFPSGHTLVAFAIGTVWADERPSERYVAYGLASAVGLSRIVKHAHWPSDVFWGAVIGITQARQAMKGNANLLTIRF
jgi:membrane-associated phospholipid phosphatase